MIKKSLDLSFGHKRENELYNTLKEYFNRPDLKKSENEFSRMDFYDNETYIELKTRRNKYNSFKTTIVSKSKIDYCIKSDKKNFYFVFSFEDGVYFIEYNKEIFDQFEIKHEYIIRENKRENKINYHIPINYLIKII